MDGTAEGLLASRRIFDEALSRFDRAMGTSLGGGGPSGGDEASAGAAVQSHRPSSSVVSERSRPLTPTTVTTTNPYHDGRGRALLLDLGRQSPHPRCLDRPFQVAWT